MTPKLRKFPSPATLWVTAVAVAIGVCWTLTYCIIVPIGDDLGYANAFRDYVAADGYSWDGVWRYLVTHYRLTNGRFANVLTWAALGTLPQWAAAVLCGGAVTAYYLLTLHFCRLYPSRRRGMAASLVIALIAVAFCWQDSFTILCVNFNYVWGMALPLALLLAVERRVPLPRRPLAAALAFLAAICVGAIHETATLPLAVALLWVSFTQGPAWRRVPGRMAWITAFITGALIATLSPGIWARAAAAATLSADAPPPVLVGVSAPLTVVLIIVYALTALTARGRQKLRRLLWSPRALWPVAAIVALPIIARGGIIGRSGFFSQTCALIALLQWFAPVWTRIRAGRRPAAVVAVVAASLAVAQLVAVIPLQQRSARAYARVIELYRQTGDGVVYYTMPADTVLPVWATSRVRNLVTDDLFELTVLQQRLRHPRPLVLLPEAARSVDLRGIREETVIRLSPTEWLSGRAPAGTRFPDSIAWTRATGAGIAAGGRLSVTPVPRGHRGAGRVYYIATRGGHFGDRDRP